MISYTEQVEVLVSVPEYMRISTNTKQPHTNTRKHITQNSEEQGMQVYVRKAPKSEAANRLFAPKSRVTPNSARISSPDKHSQSLPNEPAPDLS